MITFSKWGLLLARSTHRRCPVGRRANIWIPRHDYRCFTCNLLNSQNYPFISTASLPTFYLREWRYRGDKVFKVSQGWSWDQTSHSLTLSQRLQPSAGSHILSYKVHPGPCLHTSPTSPCVFLPPHPHSLLDAWPLLIIFPAGLTCSSMSPLRLLGFQAPTSWWRCSLVYPRLLSSLSCHIRIQQERTKGQLRIWSRWVPQVTFQLSPEACTILLLVSNHPHSSSQGSGLES